MTQYYNGVMCRQLSYYSPRHAQYETAQCTTKNTYVRRPDTNTHKCSGHSRFKVFACSI